MPAQLCQFPTMLCCTLFLFYSLFAIPQSGSSYETFRFQKFEAAVLTPYQMIHVNQENADFIQSRIKHELEIHGLRLQESPDLFINIKTTIKEEVQARDPSSGPLAFYSEDVPVKLLYGKIGTITIELEDAKKNIKVWSGARSIMLWGKNEKTLRKKTNKTIAKIFKKFDPTILAID